MGLGCFLAPGQRETRENSHWTQRPQATGTGPFPALFLFLGNLSSANPLGSTAAGLTHEKKKKKRPISVSKQHSDGFLAGSRLPSHLRVNSVRCWVSHFTSERTGDAVCAPGSWGSGLRLRVLKRSSRSRGPPSQLTALQRFSPVALACLFICLVLVSPLPSPCDPVSLGTTTAVLVGIWLGPPSQKAHLPGKHLQGALHLLLETASLGEAG